MQYEERNAKKQKKELAAVEALKKLQTGVVSFVSTVIQAIYGLNKYFFPEWKAGHDERYRHRHDHLVFF